jgi:4,5-DOPA dioxygenase extradiol
MSKLPVLFIGHGSPLNILLESAYTKTLRDLGRKLPRPKAVLVVSAHWLTKGTYVLGAEHPRQNYDFYGFPEALYGVEYRPKGSPESAERLRGMVRSTDIRFSDEWGLDHAAWAVLKHMYPAADVPAFELSLDLQKGERFHYELAAELSPLREEGVLIIGSGNIVHNLRLIEFDDIDAAPYDWAVEFDEDVKASLLKGNHERLLNYRKGSHAASLAVPTNDHYLPMVYAIGLQEKGEDVTFLYEGFQNKSISMRCFQVG